MVGPGSVEPMARQGRAEGKLETSPPVAPLEQGEGSPGADVGSYAMGSMQGALKSQGRAVKAVRNLRKYMSLYLHLTENTCFKTLNQRFLSVNFKTEMAK